MHGLRDRRNTSNCALGIERFSRVTSQGKSNQNAVRRYKGQFWLLERSWHNQCHKALQIVEDLEYALDLEENSQEQRKLLKAVREFGTYITANRTFIPNYGDRYRHGETISTAFVESAINQVVSKRMVKKQQMRWTDRGAHLLLQVRTRVLNEEWRSTLLRWYPGMQENCEAKAA
jgi:hypothetical protein